MEPISEFERLKLIEKKSTIFFPSKFKFLTEHRGLRPGEMHMLLSTTGSGKSSLVKSLIFDMAKRAKILYWLSEESVNDFRTHIASNRVSDAEIKNISVFSELGSRALIKMQGPKLIDKVREIIERDKPDILFYDNLTTSLAYADLRPDVQYQTVFELKRIAEEYNIPIFCVAHTNGNITAYNQGLLSGNDVRGGKGVINLLQYLYVFQKLHIGKNYFNFINIEKHRTQDVKDKFFALEYSTKSSSYVQDWAIDFDCVKENYGQRNILK